MNVYHDCPIDARDFTDYRSTSDINTELMSKNNIQNTFEYNKFITKNAMKIMDEQKAHYQSLYSCGPYDDTMLKEKQMMDCTKEGCNIKPYDKDGLGLGREFTKIKDCK